MNDYDALKASSLDSVVAGLQPRYLAFVSVFNSGLYFEAHEVLEPLWLSRRGHPEAPFYKGLIQLAGGFVHVQKGRLPPAIALFTLARKNLKGFAPVFFDLDIDAALGLIAEWLAYLEPDELSAIPEQQPGSRKLVLKAAEVAESGGLGQGGRGDNLLHR